MAAKSVKTVDYRFTAPSPWELRKLPPSIARCFHIVDANGMAVDFDKLSVKKRIVRAINYIEKT